MIGLSHMIIGGTTASLFLQSSDATVLATGAIASLLPDIDISISPAGRICPWVSRWFERRFPHRSCTHSLVASGIVALITYPALLYLQIPLELIHALNIGYLFGWLADMFTKNGVEMFYPSPSRWVCPGNKNFRLKTGSQAEYVVLALLVVIAILVFQINSSGGLMTQFNRLIGSTSGVEQVYNQKGSQQLISVHVEGVKAIDRAPIVDDFWIIQQQGTGFIVQAKNGAIYKVGKDPDVQIITEKITANPQLPAKISIETIRLDLAQVGRALVPFDRKNVLVFVSGKITVDYPEELALGYDPYQFRSIRVEGDTVTLEAAPLGVVYQSLNEQLGTGYLEIRSIYY
ncbi:MAG TPA: metal-dependent hydrolase [Cyanobacteria bacterium UBA8803]|nr:metal-dependent hydrolase [Cyanobacteria bacterium UBA9273]HBL61667.1 metal-dependent hydrolase [Cyanobacteria bacterium UBA8803]